MDFGDGIDCTPVIPLDSGDRNDSLPSYLVSLFSVVDFLSSKSKTPSSPKSCLNIMEFGDCTLVRFSATNWAHGTNSF